MDGGAVAPLQDLIRQESRSLLQYTSESFPWSKAKDEAVCVALTAMAQAELAAVTRLARWLAKQRVAVTFPGAYPMNFTTGNFVSLQYVLPRLAEDQRRRIADIDKTLAALPDGEARVLVGAIRALKFKHLQQFGDLLPKTPPAAVA